MTRKWKRFICTFLTSALVFTGPVIDGTVNGGYIGSSFEQVFAKTAKEKKKEAEENNLPLSLYIKLKLFMKGNKNE